MDLERNQVIDRFYSEIKKSNKNVSTTYMYFLSINHKDLYQIVLSYMEIHNKGFVAIEKKFKSLVKKNEGTDKLKQALVIIDKFQEYFNYFKDLFEYQNYFIFLLVMWKNRPELLDLLSPELKFLLVQYFQLDENFGLYTAEDFNLKIIEFGFLKALIKYHFNKLVTSSDKENITYHKNFLDENIKKSFLLVGNYIKENKTSLIHLMPLS